MCNDPLTLATTTLKAALHTCADLRFTGTVWVTWRAGCAVITSEGVGVWGRPVDWHVRHSQALAAVRVWGVLEAARVGIQLSQGVPVGSHLEGLD